MAHPHVVGKGRRDGNLEEVILTEAQEVSEVWIPHGKSDNKSSPSSGPRSVAPPAAVFSKVGTPSAREGLSPGSVVRINDLTPASRRVNGEIAVCEDWDAASNRWRVRLKSGEMKTFNPENLQAVQASPNDAMSPITIASTVNVEPGDPPLLEVWKRSAKAEAAERLAAQGLESSPAKAPLKALDLSIPPDLIEEAKRLSSSTGPVENDSDEQLLTSVEDERVVLDDLDADLQLRSSVRSRRLT